MTQRIEKALIEAAAKPGYPARIVTVISNRADAAGLAVAGSRAVGRFVAAGRQQTGGDGESQHSQFHRGIPLPGGASVVWRGILDRVTAATGGCI